MLYCVLSCHFMWWLLCCVVFCCVVFFCAAFCHTGSVVLTSTDGTYSLLCTVPYYTAIWWIVTHYSRSNIQMHTSLHLFPHPTHVRTYRFNLQRSPHHTAKQSGTHMVQGADTPLISFVICLRLILCHQSTLWRPSFLRPHPLLPPSPLTCPGWSPSVPSACRPWLLEAQEEGCLVRTDLRTVRCRCFLVIMWPFCWYLTAI